VRGRKELLSFFPAQWLLKTRRVVCTSSLTLHRQYIDTAAVWSSLPVVPPGVARSIESDVDNLMRLIRIANILPKGLYVESAVKVGEGAS